MRHNLPVAPQDTKAVRRAQRPAMTAAQFRHILRVSTGKAKYCDQSSDRMLDRETHFPSHPITGEDVGNGAGTVEFYGSPGFSDGIGAWQRAVVRQYADSLGDLLPLRFLVWNLPVDGNANKCSIIVEIQLGYAATADEGEKAIYRLMCGGMNNYSGTSGTARDLVFTFVAGFVAAHGCEVTETTVEGDTELLLDRMNAVIDEQQAEYRQGDED